MSPPLTVMTKVIIWGSFEEGKQKLVHFQTHATRKLWTTYWMFNFMTALVAVFALSFWVATGDARSYDT